MATNPYRSDGNAPTGNKEKTMETKFTAEMARTMTDAQIRQFWIDRQLARKADGRKFFDVLMDITGQIAVDLRDATKEVR
jgi:hypothetical protein